MARAASPAIAFNGLCIGIGSAALFSFHNQSAPCAIDAAVLVEVMLPVAAATAFFTAVTYIYANICGRGARAGNRWIPAEAAFVLLCASICLLDLLLFKQTGPMDREQFPLLLRAAAVQVLPPAAAVTFFLAVVLIYVNARAGGDGAGNDQNPVAVELLNKMTLAATLVTAGVSLIASSTK